MGFLLLATASRPVLGPTQPPIQWYRGPHLGGKSGWGVKLTTHLNLPPRFRIRGAIHPFPQYIFMARCL